MVQIKIRSGLVGEDIILTQEWTNLPNENCAVYSFKEIELLQKGGINPEDLKKIHSIKKYLNGEIVAMGVQNGTGQSTDSQR